MRADGTGPVQSDKIHLHSYKGIVFETKLTDMR